jgi:hypothetical protein
VGGAIGIVLPANAALGFAVAATIPLAGLVVTARLRRP